MKSILSLLGIIKLSGLKCYDLILDDKTWNFEITFGIRDSKLARNYLKILN